MGVMRFMVEHPERLDPSSDIQNAYLSGFDGRVFPSRVEFDGRVISIRRTSSESGKLQLPFPVEGFGKPVVSTATLREHETIYILPLELARGKICQVRNQLATWESLGMQIPTEFTDVYREAHKFFAKATSHKSNVSECCHFAEAALSKAHHAADLLTRAYVRQRLVVRFKKTPLLPISFGCMVNQSDLSPDAASALLGTFNAISIPVEWSSIEAQEGEYNWSLADWGVQWAQDNKLLLRAGSLLDFSENGLPHWLQQWGQDFFNLQSFICDFVETAVSRYQGKIRIWELASRVNTGGAFKLNEEERLSLLARTLEIARQVDEEAQFFIRIDQPFGAYQARGEHRLSPAQFVDALLRFGTGLAGVNLEIPVGFTGRGSAPRDLLDLSRLIDLWSVLETPLHVTLAFPSSTDVTTRCASELSVSETGWKGPWSKESQTSWIDGVVPLLMAKQSVVGIYWSHLSDSADHVFPNAGLIDAAGQLKPSFLALQKCRLGQTFG